MCKWFELRCQWAWWIVETNFQASSLQHFHPIWKAYQQTLWCIWQHETCQTFWAFLSLSFELRLAIEYKIKIEVVDIYSREISKNELKGGWNEKQQGNVDWFFIYMCQTLEADLFWSCFDMLIERQLWHFTIPPRNVHIRRR